MQLAKPDKCSTLVLTRVPFLSIQVASFELLSELFSENGDPTTERLVESRMLELIKLYKWRGWNEDANNMLEATLPQHPHQWPARYNPALADGARAWHDLSDPPGGADVAVELAALVAWLKRNEHALASEYAAAKGAGLIAAQTECLHDPNVTGEWRQVCMR